jgi:hypothetical protein
MQKLDPPFLENEENMMINTIKLVGLTLVVSLFLIMPAHAAEGIPSLGGWKRRPF